MIHARMIRAACGVGSTRTRNCELSRAKAKHLFILISSTQSEVDMYVSNGHIQLKINGVQASANVPYTSNSGKRPIFIFNLVFSDL